MESTVRKIATFYQILDTICTNKRLTRDSIDVAVKWGNYCQEFYRESVAKPFFPQLETVVDRKMLEASKRKSKKIFHVGDVQPNFHNLQRASSLVILTLLKNPHLSKDLFAYVLSLIPSAEDEGEDEKEEEKRLVEAIATTAVECASFEASAADATTVEVEMTVEFLVDSATNNHRDGGGKSVNFQRRRLNVQRRHPQDAVYISNGRIKDDFASFLRTKFQDVVEEKTGLDFVVQILLTLNSDEFSICADEDFEDGDSIEEYLNQILIDLLLDILVRNSGGVDVQGRGESRVEKDDSRMATIRPDLIHRLCLRETRILSTYLDFLGERAKSGFSEDAKTRLESLKAVFKQNEKDSSPLNRFFIL